MGGWAGRWGRGGAGRPMGRTVAAGLRSRGAAVLPQGPPPQLRAEASPPPLPPAWAHALVLAPRSGRWRVRQRTQSPSGATPAPGLHCSWRFPPDTDPHGWHILPRGRGLSPSRWQPWVSVRALRHAAVPSLGRRASGTPRFFPTRTFTCVKLNPMVRQQRAAEPSAETPAPRPPHPAPQMAFTWREDGGSICDRGESGNCMGPRCVPSSHGSQLHFPRHGEGPSEKPSPTCPGSASGSPAGDLSVCPEGLRSGTTGPPGPAHITAPSAPARLACPGPDLAQGQAGGAYPGQDLNSGPRCSESQASDLSTAFQARLSAGCRAHTTRCPHHQAAVFQVLLFWASGTQQGMR